MRLSQTASVLAALCLSALAVGAQPSGGSNPFALLERVDPESVGLSAQVLAEAGALFRAQVDRGELPGFVAVVTRHGRVAYVDAYGLRDLERGAPMTPETIFRIYSMTKPLTTVAALILIEEGRLDPDEPAARYVPVLGRMPVYDPAAPGGARPVDPARPMTVRDLLRHTSGLTYGYGTSSPVDALYHEAEILNRRGTTLQDMIDKLERLPLRYPPGSRWHYGLSTDVLGHLVEVASGRPLDAFVEARIFAPLGMVDSGFEVPREKRDRFAGIYTHTEEGLVPWGGAWETEAYRPPVTFFSGGGGAVSTTPDYLRFAQMLLNGGTLDGVRILTPESVAQMTTNQLDGDFRPGWGFGYGVQVCTDPAQTGQPGSVGTYGWGGGGNTFFFVDPAEDVIAMVWTQLSGPTSLSRDLRAAVYAALEAE